MESYRSHGSYATEFWAVFKMINDITPCLKIPYVFKVLSPKRPWLWWRFNDLLRIIWVNVAKSRENMYSKFELCNAKTVFFLHVFFRKKCGKSLDNTLAIYHGFKKGLNKIIMHRYNIWKDPYWKSNLDVFDKFWDPLPLPLVCRIEGWNQLYFSMFLHPKLLDRRWRSQS